MSEIFDNAVDSLEFGIRYYLYGEFNTAHKHAMLSVYQSIELFLKEKLYLVNPILIYKNIDKPISDESQTVGINETFARFKNLDIEIDEVQKNTLKDLQKRRNRIMHFKYEENKNDYIILGKALNFIYYFLRHHLNTTLEEILDEELFREAREAILNYQEKLNEAESEVKRICTEEWDDDSPEENISAFCPNCGNHTVVIGSDRGDFCFFCYEEVSMVQCDYCGDYFGSEEDQGFNICPTCFEVRSNQE